MAATKTQPGEILQIDFSAKRSAAIETTTLVKTDRLKVIQLAVAAGKQLATHRSPGDTTLLCLEGAVTLFVEGRPHSLSAGQLIYLPPGLPHALRGEEDSLILLTIATPDGVTRADVDPVEEASRESFPASDAPSHTPVTRP